MAIPAARESGKASSLDEYTVAHVKIRILLTREIVKIDTDNSRQQVVSTTPVFYGGGKGSVRSHPSTCLVYNIHSHKQ